MHLQAANAELPVGALAFVKQVRHVKIALAPTDVEYVPAEQSLHTTDPVDALYFPVTQAVHVPPSSPDDPALQVQLVKAALPAVELEFDGQALHVELAEAPTDVEYVPAPQLVHKVAPVSVEYVPAPQSVHRADPVNVLYFPFTHAMHMLPSGPEKPALQVQLVKAALPAGELELDGQALHVELAEAPTAVEYVPAGQAVHDVCPVATPYFPAAQT